MRLLNTHSLKLEGFIDPPPYGILSHRWGEQEVLFDDISKYSRLTMKGYPKVRDCCKQALSEGYDYVWIDTCCIDKNSSSELSEAINRMFTWYRKSEVCYVYLQDVRGDEDPKAEKSSFRNSAWFTRGWTLQELIAPTSVVFFANDWTEIGTKTTLAEVIRQITNVDRAVLVQNSAGEVSVARRMSWAANRQTTRVEDKAYSLMGIFGVNMPTLYGEGERAFFRLQYEIMRVSNDHSIFAWEGTSSSSGLLATSPNQFSRASSYERIQYREFVESFSIENPKPDYTLTNFGVHIQLPMMHPDGWPEDYFLAHLACKDSKRGGSSTCIVLQQTKELRGHYTRISTGDQQLVPWGEGGDFPIRVEEIFVAEDDPSFYNSIDFTEITQSDTFRFLVTVSGDTNCVVSSVSPIERWTQGGEPVLDIGGSGHYGTIVFRTTTTGEMFSIVLGVHNWRVWSDIRVIDQGETADAVQTLYSDGLGDFRWNGLDRVKKPLGGRNIMLTIKKRSVSADRQIDFEAKIAVVSHKISLKKSYFDIIVDNFLTQIGDKNRQLLPWSKVSTLKIKEAEDDPPHYPIDYTGITPSHTFRFIVTVSGDENFAVSSVSPAEIWTQANELSVDLGESGSFGTVVFHNTVTGEMFAAVLGVHNWRVWSDIRVIGEEETADTVQELYHKTHLKEFRWKQLEQVTKSLGGNPGGRNAMLRVKKGNISADRRVDFEAGIIVASPKT